jgi:hypothetical protein
MPAKRAVYALARAFRESEPKTFEGRRKLLEGLSIAARYDSRTKEAEIEGRFQLPGQKNWRNGVRANPERKR